MDSNIIKVFLVDDHPFVRSGLKVILENQKNMEISGEAEDAREALTLLKDIPTDIVVMDIAIPGLNGIEATLEIKGMFPSIKVLILTMYDDDQLLIDVIHAGASGYILKERPSGDLIKAINYIHKGNQAFIVPHKILNSLSNIRKHEIPRDNYETLTKREKEVLDLIANGLTNEQIADCLNIGNRTLATHRSNLLRKLQLNNRFELIDYAKRKRLTNN